MEPIHIRFGGYQPPTSVHNKAMVSESSAVSDATPSTMSSCSMSVSCAVCFERTSTTSTDGGHIAHWRWARPTHGQLSHWSWVRFGSCRKSVAYIITMSDEPRA